MSSMVEPETIQTNIISKSHTTKPKDAGVAPLGDNKYSNPNALHSVHNHHAVVNQDLDNVAHEIAIENRMFGRPGVEDDFLDDDDYAFKRERKA